MERGRKGESKQLKSREIAMEINIAEKLSLIMLFGAFHIVIVE